jgi:peptidyl-prolyl cis-trans isomerase C
LLITDIFFCVRNDGYNFERRIRMRKWFKGTNQFVIVAVVICFLTGIVWADKATSPGKEIALVNGKPISKSEYEHRLSVFKKQAAHIGRQLNDAKLKAAKNRILDNLIETEVLYQESQKEGIKVDDKVVSEQIGKIKKRFPNEAAYKKAIEKMHVSEKEFRDEILRGLVIRQLLDTKVRQKIKVTEEESKKYYDSHMSLFHQPERVKASQIWIKVTPSAIESIKKQAHKKIETIQKKINQGEDFGKLAKTYSDGPEAQHKGELGYFKRGQMAKPIEDSAFAMKIGEVSGIIETQFGYHLIKVIDKKPAETTPYNKVKTMIDHRLKKEKAKTEIQDYIENLKKSAKIKRFN